MRRPGLIRGLSPRRTEPSEELLMIVRTPTTVLLAGLIPLVAVWLSTPGTAYAQESAAPASVLPPRYAPQGPDSDDAAV